MAVTSQNIRDMFAVLKPDMGVAPVPVGPTLYADLDRDFGNFRGHALIAVHEFQSSWGTWERHPHGDEIVMLLDGTARMILHREGTDETVRLEQAGDYVIIPRGQWHRAEVSEPVRMLFITPGEGTEHAETPK